MECYFQINSRITFAYVYLSYNSQAPDCGPYLALSAGNSRVSLPFPSSLAVKNAKSITISSGASGSSSHHQKRPMNCQQQDNRALCVFRAAQVGQVQQPSHLLTTKRSYRRQMHSSSRATSTHLLIMLCDFHLLLTPFVRMKAVCHDRK